MMFKITIEGTTMAEVSSSVAALARQFLAEPAEPKSATRGRKSADKGDDAGKAEAEAPNATVLDASVEAKNGSSAAAASSETSDNAGSATTASDASGSASDASTGPSRDEVLKAAMLFGQSNGDDALKDKISKMGATKFSEIPAEKYADFVKSLEAPAAGSILD